jgi:hypothetical protein
MKRTPRVASSESLRSGSSGSDPPPGHERGVSAHLGSLGAVGRGLRRGVVSAAVLAVAVIFATGAPVGAGADDSDEPISRADAEDLALAGVLKLDDLEDLETDDEGDGKWSRFTDGYLGLQDEQGACLVLDDDHVAAGAFADDLLAARRSRVFEQSDPRGPTLVGVEIRTDTLVYASTAAAERTVAALDGDYLSSCIEQTGAQREAESAAAGDEEEGEGFSADKDIDARRVDAPDVGDEAQAFRAPFNNYSGDGDDNFSSSELYVVRVGPVVEVLYTWRYGEGHDDDVVSVATPTVPETLERLVDRIEETSER